MLSTVQPNEAPPLVSIVIPCYNHARFVGATIESALGQTYPSVEVIVVDDGSTDESGEVAARYEVGVLRQENQGVAEAMNAGIRASCGTYAMTLGADDLLHPEYVSRMVGALDQDPQAGFAYSRILFFGQVNREYPTEPFHAESLAERNYVAAVAVFRRSAFDLVGGFDPELPRCEDWDFWLSLTELGKPGTYVAEPLVFGRQHVRSYNSRDFFSVRGWRRELITALRLRDKHPSLFAPGSLLRRLARLPSRLVRRQVTPRFAALLVAFYASMLFGPRQRSRSSS